MPTTSLGDFLHARGALRPTEVYLCALCWLHARDGAPVRALAVQQAARDALPRGGPVVAAPPASAVMRRLADAGLADAHGAGRYAPTALGAEVVAALPDRRRVGALRGLARAAAGPR